MEKPPLSIARPCRDLLFLDEGTGDGTVDETRASTAPGFRPVDREHYPGQTVTPNKRNNGVGLIVRPLVTRMSPYNMVDPGN